jgi:hypothetical protein
MPAALALPPHCLPSLLPPRCQQAAAAGKLPLPLPPPPPLLPLRCCRTSCRGAAANEAVLPLRCQAGRRCRAAAATAAAALLPPPRYCRHPAAVLPVATALLPPPLPRCHHRCRAVATAATAALPWPPLPCCRHCHRRHANATAAPNGLLPVLEEELRWPYTIIMMLNSSVLMLGQK